MSASPKPSRTARKLEQHKTRVDRRNKEDAAKARVRRRDKHRCRFPLCGCSQLGLRLEVSHQTHKGMGGNPKGDRSSDDKLILLCEHRHQHGAISRHKGTLRILPLTLAGTNGPVSFLVDLGEVGGPDEWFEVARERDVQQLEPLSERQRALLEQLGDMGL